MRELELNYWERLKHWRGEKRGISYCTLGR
jgi:hypothetical protein